MKYRLQLPLSMFLLAFCTSTPGQMPDPLNQWQIIANTGIGDSILGLAYRNGHFVAAGVTTNLFVSTNGVNWGPIPSGLTGFGGIKAVTEGPGMFVAVGHNGLILSSPDGRQWSQLRTDLRDEHWAVIYAGGQFVSVGFHSASNGPALALTSNDGVHWERFVQPFATTPRNVAYGQGIYVAAGWPVSMSSTNGRDWTPLNSVGASGIAYGGGQFVATAQTTGHISSNGVDWAPIVLPATPSGSGNYYTASYANGTFIIGGFCDFCTGGNYPSLLATSADGRHWTSRVFGSNYVGPIRDIVFVDGAFYLGGQDGRIWKSGRTAPSSPPVITQATHAGGQSTLSFSVLPGFHYAVECADRLDSTAWRSCAGPLFATDTQLAVTDPEATTQSRFYRIRVE